MNLPLARFAARLLAHRPWRAVLLAFAVATTSAWLAARTMADGARVAEAEAAARSWPAVIATTADATAASTCNARHKLERLASIPGAGAARPVVACQLVAHQLDVPRAEEAEAIALEVADALGPGWEVTTRDRLRTAAVAALERNAGLGTLSATPIVLSLLFLVLALGHGGTATVELVGKLKLLGWSTVQVVWLFGLRSLAPCLAGCVLGVAAAALSSSGAELGWLRALAGAGQPIPFAWSTTLNAALSVVAFVLAPCVVASMSPAVRLARADPAQILEAG